MLITQHASYANTYTWLDTHFIERAFLDVALKNEYSVGDKPLVKWSAPLSIWVDHQVGDKALHDELTDAHISHLAKITGHPIQRVSDRKQANVIWVFTQTSEWLNVIERELGKSALKNSHGAVCKAGYRTTASGVITSGSVIIPVDQARSPGKLIACIVEEITQIMGLPNDAESAYPSIFNDKTPEDLLSPLDVVLLKLLYEPSLKQGMDNEQVRSQIRVLLRGYEKNGTLSNAVSIARSGELYKLLGY
jgi:hypothetical protein